MQVTESEVSKGYVSVTQEHFRPLTVALKLGSKTSNEEFEVCAMKHIDWRWQSLALLYAQQHL